MKEIRGQLWAEARHRYQAGEKWWLEGDALEGSKFEQENRRLPDPWEEIIGNWIAETEVDHLNTTTHTSGRRIYTTVGEVLTHGIKMEASRQTKRELDRCGRILGNVYGWTRGMRRVGSTPTRVWYPPERVEGEVVDLRPVQGDLGDEWEKGRG